MINQPIFALFPPILFLLTSNSVMCVGWWKLRWGKTRHDTWFGVIGLYVGFAASVWGWVTLV